MPITIKQIFQDHWERAALILQNRFSEEHWQSIEEIVAKMLKCRDPSQGYAEYICVGCGKKIKVPFT